jgi:hypothetical protein
MCEPVTSTLSPESLAVLSSAKTNELVVGKITAVEHRIELKKRSFDFLVQGKSIFPAIHSRSHPANEPSRHPTSSQARWGDYKAIWGPAEKGEKWRKVTKSGRFRA